MSVMVTMRVSGDSAAFEKQAAADPEAIVRIMEVAKRNGLIAHRWFGRDGEVMAVDEWPDGESFHTFMDETQADVGPFMEAVGVTSPPDVTVWRPLQMNDEVGWGA